MSPTQRHSKGSQTKRLIQGCALLVLSVALPIQAQSAGEAAASDLPPKVELVTSEGTIVLELEHRRAPLSVNNFLNYVNKGFYDNTIFHRVIESFMIQGGGFTPDFQKKDTAAPIKNEANNGLKNRHYTISMARTNAPHSATAQFFINTTNANDFLDYTAATQRGWGYAVFGRVIAGKDVVDNISRVPTGAGGPFSRDAPQRPIVINSAKVIVPEPAPSGGAGDAVAANGKSSSLDSETAPAKTE